MTARLCASCALTQAYAAWRASEDTLYAAWRAGHDISALLTRWNASKARLEAAARSMPEDPRAGAVLAMLGALAAYSAASRAARGATPQDDLNALNQAVVTGNAAVERCRAAFA